MPHRPRTSTTTLFMLALLSQVCTAATGASHNLSLAGPWQVKIDEEDKGLAEQWFAQPLQTAEVARLPGSLAQGGLGHRFDPGAGRYQGLLNPPYLKWPSAGYTDAHRRDDLGVLVADRMTYGPAWFERMIEIPQAWAGRRGRLSLERVKWASQLWIDGAPLKGEGTRSLHTPHVYDLGPLTPGTHRLTLRVDNRPQVHMGIAGHGYGMETEPLWLGAVGELQLAALDPQRVERLTARSAAGRRVQLNLELASDTPLPAGATLTVRVVDPADDRELGRMAHPLRPADIKRPLTLTVMLQEAAKVWDEFNPKLYEIRWDIEAGVSTRHTGSERVGFRIFERRGRRITLNGMPVFLRGNLDCAIHPDSHTPPTERAWWERVLKIHKQAGFNHVRFHTWCPPQVAFEVADELGLYFQIETAYWVDDWIHRTDPMPHPIGRNAAVDAWVEEESLRIIRQFEQHPSFAMFCIGNEFGLKETDWDKMQSLVARLNAATDHALVTGACARKSMDADEYWVTHHSGAATRGLGPRNTDWDFSPAVQASDKPVIAHETGQRPSWPDYDVLLRKFTGVMQPWNLRRLRDRAEAAGCRDHARRAEAAARFALLQYKSEHEGQRRTPDMAGYQLLMLHDFTGQGEAHVGLLDPFFDAKPGITLAAIRAWNGPTVPLARFDRYTWTADQTFTAKLQVAHEGPGVLENIAPRWQLVTLDRGAPARTIAEGTLPARDVPHHATSDLGAIQVPLADVKKATALRLIVRVDDAENQWNLWVYPPFDSQAEATPAGLHLTRRFDQAAQDKLAQGGAVVLLSHGMQMPSSRKINWASTYWTGAWGWGNGMGLLVDPAHPGLADFPTAAHSDWQWHELIQGGQALQLPADVAASMGPAAIVVENLSDFHVPAREACVFNAMVGQGKLLVCGLDLNSNLRNRHAARALRASLLGWAASDAFNPTSELSPAQARDLLVMPSNTNIDCGYLLIEAVDVCLQQN